MSFSKDQFRSEHWASVLNEDDVIVVTVLGDEGVGKTSLVRVVTSEVFTEEDTRGTVVEPAILEKTPDRLCLHVRDTPSFLSTNVERLYQELELANVVILCYAVDQPSSLRSLESYWLPRISSFHKRLPVLVVATKSDLDNTRGDSDEIAAVEAILTETDSLLTKFPNVERVMRCSAKNAVDEVIAVFNEASFMAMYPVAPLLDEATDTLTKQCDIALTRIFRIFDHKHKNFLSIAELGMFQTLTFRLKLSQAELTTIAVDVVQREMPEAVKVEPNGSVCVTEMGFKRVVTMFIQNNMPESAWSVLKSFNYNKDLVLQIPTFKFHLARDDQAALLSPAAEGFLESLFNLYAKSEQVLTPAHLSDIFRIVPGGELPFGPRFPYNTRCTPRGDLPRDSWLMLWHMLAMVNPELTMRTMYCLGFGLKFDRATLGCELDAAKALVPGPCRKTDLRTPSKLRRCFVVGSAGCGKSTIIHQFLNKSLRVDIPPTKEPVHYVKRPPHSSKTDVSENRVSEEDVSRRPQILVITEYPADMLGHAVEDAKWQCDVFLIVVDPASDDSITYLRNAIENVPDRVPTLVVTCPHAVSPTGADKVKSLCADVEVEAFEVNPRVGENNVAEVFQYAAMHAPTPWLDNPQTLSRRERLASEKKWAKIKFVGGVVFAVGVAAALVWYGVKQNKSPSTAAVGSSKPNNTG